METEDQEIKKPDLAMILDGLAKPIPKRFLKTRQQGGAELTYIEWHTAVRFLDFYTGGNWSSEVRDIAEIGERIVVTVRVTIYAGDATVYRESTGTEFLGEKFRGYGEPTTNAEAQAFKRAASKFGLGLYLYEKK